MKKAYILLLTLLLLPLVAGLYGILHDQLTYTICPEYYTRFKFIQFGLGHPDPPRLGVTVVGFLATWWTGLFIGIIHGLTGLLQPDARTMRKAIARVTLITMAVTLLTGLAGLAYGKLYLSQAGVDWLIPDNLEDRAGFIAVGSMHNFSYLGGLLGLIAGVVYQVRWRKRRRVHEQSRV